MKSKPSTVTAPTTSSKKAEAKRIVEEALLTIEQLRQEMMADQNEIDRLGRSTDETLAHLKRKLGI